MILLQTVEDRMAFEIGAQALERHKLAVQIDDLQKQIAWLQSQPANSAAEDTSVDGGSNA